MDLYSLDTYLEYIWELQEEEMEKNIEERLYLDDCEPTIKRNNWVIVDLSEEVDDAKG